jgi:hypothetical protein
VPGLHGGVEGLGVGLSAVQDADELILRSRERYSCVERNLMALKASHAGRPLLVVASFTFDTQDATLASYHSIKSLKYRPPPPPGPPATLLKLLLTGVGRPVDVQAALGSRAAG